MLHIILGILKLIGIILAVILILLLGIGCSILFLPVRYRSSVIKTSEKMEAQIQVSWLLKLFGVAFSYDPVQRKKVIHIRLFGISLDKIKELLHRHTERKKKRLKKKQARKLSKHKTMKKQKSSRKPERNKKQESVDEAEQDLTEKQISEESMSENQGDSSSAAEELVTEKPAENSPEPASPILEHQEEESQKTKLHTDESRTEQTRWEAAASNWKKKRTQLWEWLTGLRKKMQTCLERWKKIPGKIRAVCEKILCAVQNVMQMPEQIAEKLAGYQKLWQEYEGKEVLGDITAEAKHLLDCYKPRHIKGYLHFGTGDPAATGQILGVMYLFLPAKAGGFLLQPEFTEPVLETELFLAGRIRLNHLAAAGWRMFRNKRLKRAIRMLKKERRK